VRSRKAQSKTTKTSTAEPQSRDSAGSARRQQSLATMARTARDYEEYGICDERGQDWFLATNMTPLCAHATPSIHVSCLKQYIDSCKYEIIATRAVRCIDPTCSQKVSRGILLAQLLNLDGNAAPSGFPCPSGSCPGYVAGIAAGNALPCSECGVSYCLDCGTPQASHGRPSCRGLAIGDTEGQLMEVQSLREYPTCPSCEIRYEKVMGCPHMACKVRHLPLTVPTLMEF
jgi:hypothetical protein